MTADNFKITNLNIKPVKIELYVPPVTWRGDPKGHIGRFDVFFWVLEGEIILFVDSDYYIVKAGQLAFLPKGKMRKYTQISKSLSMYEMRFSAENETVNLMKGLGLDTKKLVTDIKDIEYMNKLFETSYRNEMNKNPIYDVHWCSNILQIIKFFYDGVNETTYNTDKVLEPVIEYMKNNISTSVSIDALANIVHMQKTYFIRKFKKYYGSPPLTYFGTIKLHKAMELLVSTNKTIDEIANEVGINDTSYFSRWFKKSCSISPTEFKKLF